jgi:putative ribosome biogenesis GTPase RsgA
MDSSYTPFSPPVTLVVVGLMGQGKSTFINKANGSDAVTSSQSQSCTTDVKVFSRNGLTLIDTPGHGDPMTTEEEVNALVAKVLAV